MTTTRYDSTKGGTFVFVCTASTHYTLFQKQITVDLVSTT